MFSVTIKSSELKDSFVIRGQDSDMPMLFKMAREYWEAKWYDNDNCRIWINEIQYEKFPTWESYDGNNLFNNCMQDQLRALLVGHPEIAYVGFSTSIGGIYLFIDSIPTSSTYELCATLDRLYNANRTLGHTSILISYDDGTAAKLLSVVWKKGVNFFTDHHGYVDYVLRRCNLKSIESDIKDISDVTSKRTFWLCTSKVDNALEAGSLLRYVYGDCEVCTVSGTTGRSSMYITTNTES